MPGPNHAIKFDGIRVPDARGTHGKRREQRLSRLVNKAFEMREHGSTLREIREALHTSESAVERILHDSNNVRRRLAQYNEQLRSVAPIALRVVRETLESTAPQLAGERARMAQWVLESTKTVGKESPVNIFIKEGDTNITMSNDTLEAAKAVAAAMRATVEVKALPENVIDVEPIEEQKESNDEHTGVNVGVVPSTPEGNTHDSNS
jgi:transcriptional regulator